MIPDSGQPSQRLFKVPVLVRPKCEHPLYYEWGSGLLLIWLLDDSAESAAQRAQKIFDALPYESVHRVGAGVRDGTDDCRPQVQGGKQMAMGIGVGFTLFTLVIGVEELEIFKQLEQASAEDRAGEDWKTKA